MFVFGHIGIGRTLVHRWRARLPAVPLVFGMLLPDIIDKPLYYARLSPFISCTRTFGHSGVLLATIAIAAWTRRSRSLGAVAVGIVTHLLLDGLMDLFGNEPGAPEPSASWIAFTWPLHGWHFAYHYLSLSAHMQSLVVGPVIAAEIIGGGLLVWEWRRRARRRASRRPS
jgi:hypothetical protein